ncbi:MAG: SufD family Fe-S cluster assembly protein, partial [Bacteroidetes bacterium]|nr:SufD family Fe-S cluster assembly protein [Bacteroidota bacterium]
NNLDILLNGEGCNANLNGLYSNYENQIVDNHSSVEHRFPNCTSNQLYKGILNESSRAVFNGKIFVKDIAQQTNSYQLNKNLLLGSKARIDTKPQLEIFADDVKCTHGATIGRLDEASMFYLRSRGIPVREAKSLLTHAFAHDVIARIDHDVIRQTLDEILLKKLSQLKDSK